jgi:site-specific DNA-cytosine methylase
MTTVPAPEIGATLKASGKSGARTSDVEQTIVASETAPTLLGSEGGGTRQEEAMGEPVIGFHVAPRVELQDRPRDDGNAPTLMRGATPGATAPAGLRRLTPTECERLQGWPDGWTARPARANGKRRRGT